ncbi:MAG: TonB-dependent receptor [Colwellia sp.]
MKIHKLNYLSLMIGTLLGTSSLCAVAQETAEVKEEEKEIEVIEVRGMLSSIKESLFIKQNSIQIVDAIVAEDIGKFPDQNVAEALQRITGVTITRNAGEGQNVVVRGLGGDYNVTTVNGRRMASEHSSRDFNYDLIAAELLGGVEIYKSSVAHTQEGGIGSVINIKTRRPMDFDGFTMSVTAKGIYEDRTKDTTPQASFLISDTFLDGTFGALFTGVYSERTLRIDNYEGEGFWNDDGESWITIRQDVDGDGEFDPYVDNEWGSIVPGYMRYGNKQDTRERIGGSMALQWIPTDDIEVVFDGLYSSYTTDGTESQISFITYDESWTEGIPGVKDLGFNDEGLINKLTLFGNGAMAELLNVSNPRKTETYQLGLNTTWHLNDELSLSFDVSHSSSENKNNGQNRYIVARGFVDEITLDLSGSNLLPDVTLSSDLNSSSPIGAHYSNNDGTNIKDEVTEFKVDAKWEPVIQGFEWITSVDFGINIGEQEKQTNQYSSENPSAFSNGGIYLEADKYSHYDVDLSSVENMNGFDLFRLPADVIIDGDFDNFFKGEPGKHPDPWPRFDYDALYAFYQTISPQAAEDLIKATYKPKDSYNVNEATKAIYVQVYFEEEIFDLPFVLNLGTRAIETTVGSKGYSLNLDKVIFVHDANGNLSYEGKTADYQDIVVFEDKYTDVLPSFNFKLNLTDELIFRTAGAKVITRPSIQSLKAYSYINFKTMEFYSSNPGLDPLRANQLDATLEWYFSEYGALTSAFFYKDIESFVISGENGTQDIKGEEFKVFSSINGDGGGFIKGYELAYQQSFTGMLPDPFDGLGVQLNYTYVDSGYDDVPKGHPEFTFRSKGLPYEGMSKHSYNVVVYYEKDATQARFAYNWRGKYIKNAQAWGGEEWVAPYGQLDFSASYDVNEMINVNVSGTNLTNERSYDYIIRPDQVHHLSSSGRLFTAGISLRF